MDLIIANILKVGKVGNISILENPYRKGRRVGAKTGIYRHPYISLYIYISNLPYLPSTFIFLKVDKVDSKTIN